MSDDGLISDFTTFDRDRAKKLLHVFELEILKQHSIGPTKTLDGEVSRWQ